MQQDAWGKIAEIKKSIRDAGFKPNPYAKVYIDALGQAAMEGEQMYNDAMHGVKVQVIYICSNLRPRGDDQKRVKKELLDWAKSK